MFVLGINGASGSGKSTLAEALLLRCKQAPEFPSAALIPVDAYYRDLAHLTFAERDLINFDHPDAIEFTLMHKHLGQLRLGHPIELPNYDFSRHTRVEGGERIDPPELLIVEGLLLAANEQLCNELDFLIFVETPLPLCLERRIARDAKVRGRSPESVREFWMQRVLPMYEQFGQSAQQRANLTLSGEASIAQMVESVVATLTATLAATRAATPGLK